MPSPTPPYPATPRPEELAESIIKVYEKATDELLVNIASRFNIEDVTAGSSYWQFEMLAKMGKLTQENIATIARLTGQTPEMMQEALTQAALMSLDNVEPALQKAAKAGLLAAPSATPMISPRITSLLQELQMQSLDSLNLVNTVMLNSSLEAYRKGITTTVFNVQRMTAAQGILNEQTGEVVLGTKSRQQAVRDAVKQMIDNGLTGFVDKAGRQWQPESYVSMDIGTTMHNTYVRAALNRNQDYGNDLVYPGIKPTSRPLCYPWQGKILSTSNRSGYVTDLNDNQVRVYALSETTYGEPAGIWGINCGHSCNVFIPELSVIRGDVPPQDENDKRYAESQQLTTMRREVRYAKRDAAAAKVTNDTEMFDKAALRVKQKQAQLIDYANQVGMPAEFEKTQTYGYNRSVASSVTWAAKR